MSNRPESTLLNVMAVWAALLAACVALGGCAGTPRQSESTDYRARAQTQVDGRVSVSAVVLSPLESQISFGLPLASKGIQPVWLELDNQEDHELFLMLPSLDADYYAPSEVAWKFRSQGAGTLEENLDRMLDRQVPVVVSPRSTVSGYVYSNLDPGAKAFTVELFGDHDLRSFEFAQIVPGFEADFMSVDFEQLYPPGEVRDLDLDGLRQYLEALPCCVLGGDRRTDGDPLNLVIVGNGRDILAALVSRGWDLTETLSGTTAWRTAVSSLFGSKYRTSPVSPLYLFDRPQDVALQKTRRNVDERNHLRLWLAPVTMDGNDVLVGQISRDIGVKLSSKTFVTHKIDPVVDEARLYVTLDVAGSGVLSAVGYVTGVGPSVRDAPRYNYTKDPFHTDGLRVVLVMGDDRNSLEDFESLPWERPPGRESLQQPAPGDQ